MTGPALARPPYIEARLLRMKVRRDFLAANRGRRYAAPGFVLLVHDRKDGDSAIRFGVTVTKKIGNAVVRNRMKRRFRELARALMPTLGQPGADHVLIGRARGVERDFDRLHEELTTALDKTVRPSVGIGNPHPVRPEPVEGPLCLSEKEHKASRSSARTELEDGTG